MATPIQKGRGAAALAKVKTGAKAAGGAVARGARRVGGVVASGARRAGGAVARGANVGIRSAAKGTAMALRRARWEIAAGGFVSGLVNETLWEGVATRFTSSDMGDAAVHGGVGLVATTAGGGASYIPGPFRRLVSSLGGLAAGFGAGQLHEAGRLIRRSWSKGTNPERDARRRMAEVIKALRLKAKAAQAPAQLPAGGAGAP